jgi:hypothetical protein
MPGSKREQVLTLLLAAVAAVLAALLAAEWSLLNRDGSSSARPSAPRATGTMDRPADGEDFALPALEAYPEMVQRPLFMENRRPGVDVPEAPPPPPPATPMTLKLMGVVQTPSGKTALFVDAKGKYQRRKPGDTLDGWVLVELTPDRATLQQGDRREQLTLLKKRPKPPPNVQPPPPPAGQPPRPGQPGFPGQPVYPGQPPVQQPSQPYDNGGEVPEDGSDPGVDGEAADDSMEENANP